MKKIMILGASILQLPAIKKAKELGLNVVAVDRNPDAIGFKEDGIIKELISTVDIPAILAAAKRHKIDGIMTLASDMPMRAVAVVAEELGLVGISEDTAIKATNKAAMRLALQENNVPIPLFYKITNKDEYIKAVERIQALDMKCIVKPADNSGSHGIILLKNYDKSTIEDAYDYSIQFSRSGNLMVEEYMEGPEVSVETLNIDGVCNVIQVTDKLTSGAPFFVEMGHNEPSLLSESIKDEIIEVAIAANYAIGIEMGPSHTEIKVTKNGPKIVELGARLGGDNITTHLVPLSTGIDMVENCIKIALGYKPEVNLKYKKGSAIRYFRVDHGKIIGITGIEEAKKINGVKQISVVHGIGETIDGIKSSIDRAGFIIAQADTPKEAIRICEAANDVIQIEVETDV